MRGGGPVQLSTNCFDSSSKTIQFRSNFATRFQVLLPTALSCLALACSGFSCCSGSGAARKYRCVLVFPVYPASGQTCCCSFLCQLLPPWLDEKYSLLSAGAPPVPAIPAVPGLSQLANIGRCPFSRFTRLLGRHATHMLVSSSAARLVAMETKSVDLH